MWPTLIIRASHTLTARSSDAVVGRGRQPGGIVREGHRADVETVALERLKTVTPSLLYSRLNYYIL